MSGIHARMESKSTKNRRTEKSATDWPVRYLPVELRSLGLFQIITASTFPTIPAKQMTGATMALMTKLSWAVMSDVSSVGLGVVVPVSFPPAKVETAIEFISIELAEVTRLLSVVVIMSAMEVDSPVWGVISL